MNGIKQIPMQGTSMVYTFNDGNAKRDIRRNISRLLVTEVFTKMVG